MNFYQVLRELIKKEIVPHHDGLIEGGIGNNFSRYKYLREFGYNGVYIGVNSEEPNFPPTDGLIVKKGDCFNREFLASVLDEYGIKSPLFLTNSALSDCLLLEGIKISQIVESLTDLFKKQLHLKPTGKFPVTSRRVFFPEEEKDREFARFIEFLKESRQKGWKEKIWRNIVLLEQDGEKRRVST